MAALPDGMIAVADTENHRVVILKLDGTVVRIIGTGVAGAGNNQLKNPNRPFGVAVHPNETLAVADTNNERLVNVKLDGTVE